MTRAKLNITKRLQIKELITSGDSRGRWNCNGGQRLKTKPAHFTIPESVITNGLALF